ncbi:MAG: hypothetical protein LC670_10440 [Flavobacteriales bacterium]|nr:hypothetical protein [Flavobacteriales bacterium]
MKTTLRFLFIAVTGALMASCISNKRIVYLQDYSKAKPHNYLADTVFNATGDAYLIEQGDIIYVKSDHPEMSQNIGRMDNSSKLRMRCTTLLHEFLRSPRSKFF